MIEFLTDPAVWVGLLTLVVMEVVLGIDNLIFIAILADKLPPHQRDRARIIGLSLALFMRLGLLSVVSWLVTLTTPLFSVFGHGFSGRDLILLGGGLFLLFKATTELHERLEGVTHAAGGRSAYATFPMVVAQIVVLDAVFSLDAVITAVGMVDQLPVMIAAVVISIVIMLFASKPLTRFVNAHPTVVVLCLSFLLMIGLTLVAEGLGFHLPKGYLYAAMGFSILIEFFNQWARRSAQRHEARLPLRGRTAESVLRLLGSRRHLPGLQAGTGDAATAGTDSPAPAFAPEESNMVSGVLTLGERTVRSIMTPRTDVSWIDLNDTPEAIRQHLLEAPHGLFPVCRGTLDTVLGVARAKDLLAQLMLHGRPDGGADLRPPVYLPESLGVLKAIDVLRGARGQLALVTDDHGTVAGVVTPVDVLEAIAGEFPDEDETPEVQATGDGEWTVAGTADLHQLEVALDTTGLAGDGDRYMSVAGLLLARLGRQPQPGDTLEHGGFTFRVVDADAQRVRSVAVARAETPGAGDTAA